MDQQRARSSSQGRPAHISQSRSPSGAYSENVNPNLGLGLDPSYVANSNPQLSNGDFNKGVTSFDPNSQFLNPRGLSQSSMGENFQSQNFNQQFESENLQNQSLSPFSNPSPHDFTSELLNPNLNLNSGFQGDFPLFSAPGTQAEQFDQSFYVNSDPQQNNQSINPADIMSDISPTQGNTQSPPNMLQPGSRRQSSTSQHSPSFTQGPFQRSPGHSRNVSLGPESAAFVNGQPPADWSMMANQFSGHRRAPSEYSDISSVAPSPNLPQHDSFETDTYHSPMIGPQDPSLYQEVMNIQNFSLSDPQVHPGSSPRMGFSPSHSPAISPRISPAPAPALNQQDSLMMGMNNSSLSQSISSETYNSQVQDQYHRMQRNDSEGGQAQQMVPPDINIEFAPASRQNSFEPPKPAQLDQDALTPPERGRRRRALSDPYHVGVSRPTTPASISSMSPGVGSDMGSLSPSPSPQPARSLSPFDRSATSSPSHRRRQSTSSLPNRDYILGLADPDYSATPESGGSKRVQKHPANFQCTLCPKRFTRAYNLRSHLRTHTDERPFVCTVCGKAFARQHDRKRHEGLHSGEKKFVCKGELKQGGQWGCGRRFARADALGRHFRSEAGRVCIRPLLEEEHVERQRQWQEQQMQNMAQNMQQPQPIGMDGFPMGPNGGFALPAALLQQYPALATLQWSDMPQGDTSMDDDISGRSSFDASGSEYYDEADEQGYVSGPGTGFAPSPGFVDYTSDYGGR